MNPKESTTSSVDLLLKKARNTAAGYLSQRMYTCREIHLRLCRKGFSEDVAEQVVAEFIEAGYLNDALFAKLYAEDQIKMCAKGSYRIRQELLQKGVAAGIIDDALKEAEADTMTALREFVEMRNLCDTVHSRKDLEKLKARLARRGYSPGEIRQCLSEYTFTFTE